MKMVKSLILGSAAGLIAMSGAQAADLPVKAKAVEYVRICSLYGAGFYYMPGTDTCIKFGGYLRADTSVGAGDYSFMQSTGSGAAVTNNQGSNNRLTNYWYARARMDFTVDTRTATEYGVVRTFADMIFSYDTTSVIGAGNGTNYGTGGAASLGLYHAFIQFAGFTFGRTVSAFDAPWQSYPAGGPDTLPGGSNHVTGVDQVTYTAQFGNGVSASISVQDGTTLANGQAALWNTNTVPGAGFVLGTYGVQDGGGTRMPDVVGNVTVDQAWGLFKLSAAVKDLHPGYYFGLEPTGHPGDKWGWAVQAALSIKNIPTGPGDSINLQAVYTDGATKYNFQSLFPGQFAMYSGTGLAGAYQSIGFASVADGVFGSPGGVGTSIDTVKSWGFRGGYTHNWSPNWASAIYGAYGVLNYGSTGKVLVCANFFASVAATPGTTCNPDFAVAAIGGNVVWTPVKNLAFTADVVWTHLDQKYSGSAVIPAIATAAKPTALYEFKDQNSVSMLLRAQRNF
jgi:hypothetical protein